MATSKRVMVTPARLFEFLTTLTFRVLHRNHIVSTEFVIEQKKNAWEYCVVKKKKHVYDGFKKKKTSVIVENYIARDPLRSYSIKINQVLKK